MTEGSIRLAMRMDVLKEKMTMISNRLPAIDGVIFRDLMQSQMEVMRNILDLYWNGNTAHPTSSDDDEQTEKRWEHLWKG